MLDQSPRLDTLVRAASTAPSPCRASAVTTPGVSPARQNTPPDGRVTAAVLADPLLPAQSLNTISVRPRRSAATPQANRRAWSARRRSPTTPSYRATPSPVRPPPTTRSRPAQDEHPAHDDAPSIPRRKRAGLDGLVQDQCGDAPRSHYSAPPEVQVTAEGISASAGTAVGRVRCSGYYLRGRGVSLEARAATQRHRRSVMRASRLVHVLLAFALLGVLGAAPAMGAPLSGVLATDAADGPVAAYSNTAAWSRWDDAAGVYRVVVDRGGTIRTLDVPPSSGPLGLSAGRGPDGRRGWCGRAATATSRRARPRIVTSRATTLARSSRRRFRLRRARA